MLTSREVQEIIDELEVEVLTFTCPKCQQPIETHWMRDNTGMLPGDYVLAGDSVFHPQCWDQILLENPIDICMGNELGTEF